MATSLIKLHSVSIFTHKKMEMGIYHIYKIKNKCQTSTNKYCTFSQHV